MYYYIMYGLNYDGLKKRETYDEIIDYLQNRQEKIKYPDRTAKRLRNSPQLSNLLDGNGGGSEEMDKQQSMQIKEMEKENVVRNMASQANETAQVLRVNNAVNPNTQFFNIAGDGNGAQDIMDIYEDTENERARERARRNAEITRQVMNMLSGTGRLMGGATMLLGRGVFNLAAGTFRGAAGASGVRGEAESGEDEVPRLPPAPARPRNRRRSRRPPQSSESLTEEARRRTDAGERPDDVLDDFIRRMG